MSRFRPPGAPRRKQHHEIDPDASLALRHSPFTPEGRFELLGRFLRGAVTKRGERLLVRLLVFLALFVAAMLVISAIGALLMTIF